METTAINLLSERVKNLSESATIAMARKSRELKAQGIDVISLSLGEPDFNTPDFIKQAAKEGIDQNYSKYMAVNGYEDLRMAISAKFKRDNNINYSKDQIVVSTGAKQSIANVVLSLINPGDEVIIPAPYWVSYEEIVKMAEGVPVGIETSIENDFKITPDQLKAAINTKTKLMIYSSPCNPSGSVYTKEELRGLADVLKDHPSIVVISDEIYEHINFTNSYFSMAAFDDMYNQVVTVNGVSKSFAMTGWRLGYIGAPNWIASACTKIQGQFTSGASSISQRAALAAVSEDPKVVIPMKNAFLERRNYMIKELRSISGFNINEPEGAFYLFPDVSAFFGKEFKGNKITNADELCLFLLEEAKVALVTGNAFGSPNCIRISYAASMEELKEAIGRIKNAISLLH
ncbi:MAG: pyridoxal phosphate-dependent aminotransferase [Bacteroidota bacterium]|jgi:aspartate aminotransferase|nr:pyridoxal phosphate-dependent aminotransferase [Bacteroidota bacterium]|tara:strand:+ start:290 stop:1498 length:1209 start_codon:yes stop_codon:yes gene_type:complete